ncbi:hypothetical protein [Streptomyces sp. NPDC059631]|uniref:hypothetical protein n=1 Tax=unclassified Streptomyces TaxID=2593676 RepID=UPI00368861CB
MHDLSLRDCRAGGVLHGVRFNDVSVHDLGSGERVSPFACVFRHVTLSGRIPRLVTRPAHSSLPAGVQEAFRDGAERFCASVDRALDISAAKFSGAEFSVAEFSGVPGHLVHRNPKTQFLLHRDRAGTADAEGFSSRARSSLAKARTPYPTPVVVAPTRSKYFKDMLQDPESLRAAGIAE